ncbi:hypothetical protein Daesc_005639 [Daldinia eschscholtzii]|uniref:F-box domain-containing protein n=1 Tax=Daldinia eschscholtzii TaxID=292717 RepID=A0AAX6MLI1_9PEZI
MRKLDVSEDEKLGELEDKTEALTLHLLSLPYELVLEILALLRPSDVFNLQRVNRSFYQFIIQEEHRVSRAITSWRYVCLEKCFRLPVLMEQVDPSVHAMIRSPERQELLIIHKKPYQHIQSPNPKEICTCLTCLLRWSALCFVADFAHWQRNLDVGEPIPMIPRGRHPAWNQDLIASNAAIVRKALRSPLWHARLLEAHLDSTTRSISRHAANKGNKRRRFRMTKEDMESGSDLFLEKTGPPSFDFPFHRDNYYMLEAYLPNRGWSAENNRWMYVPAEQHDIDIQYIVNWSRRRHQPATASSTSKLTREGQEL